MMNKELVKQYKNGNKLWRYRVTCYKCHGTGKVPFTYADGVCFDCDGAGWYYVTEKELSPENQEKEDAKRAAKEAEWKAKEAEREAKRLQKEIDECHRKALIENKWFDQKKAEADASNHVGNIGDRITVKMVSYKEFQYEAKFGWNTTIMSIYIMKDASGNVYKWNTSNGLGYYVEGTKQQHSMVDDKGYWEWHNVEENEEFIVTGTIKEHAEYEGVKQTVLTRCKIKAA